MGNLRDIQLMADIETLGTTPGCAILSVAVVPFQAGGLVSDIEHFYERISPASCVLAGLHTDDRTVTWWAAQDEETRNEAFSGTQNLSASLSNLHDYISGFPADTYIWGLGASFDVPILEAAYAAFQRKPPWSYRASMCFRTLKALYPQVSSPAQNRQKHSALEDARFQAKHAERILEWLLSH